jgi:hypothetical protein
VNEVDVKLLGPLHEAVAPVVEEDPSNVTEVTVQFNSLSAPAFTFGIVASWVITTASLAVQPFGPVTVKV